MAYLGQLRAHPAIIPLLRLLDQLERDDDWAHNELPAVFAMIGAPAIEPVSEYLLDRTKNEFTRATAAQALTLIAERYPEQGERCSAAMIHCLRGFETNPDTLNGLLLAELLHLHETGVMDLRGHAAVIEQAFQANAVDCSVAGDWEDVQIELGLLDRRLTPARNYLAEKMFGGRAAQGHAFGHFQACLFGYLPAQNRGQAGKNRAQRSLSLR